MIDPAVLDALLSAGATAEMIVAAVKADMEKTAAALNAKREKDASRQRKSRASRIVTVTSCDNNGHTVTSCDDLSPKEKSPAPPKEITPIQSSLRSDTPEAETQKRKRGPAGDVREILATVLSPEVAAGVIEHRQKLRKPLTGLAADGLVKAFAKTGAPDAAARMMIERGWQGFEPAWFANERGSGQANGGAAARASPSKYEKTYNLGFGVDTASAANVRKLVESFLESGKWDLKSPKPGEPGCRVPDEFLPTQYQQKRLAEAG